jgi:hypothetical protein
MLFGLIFSLSLAQASMTGVVKDSSGGAVSGASVMVRTESGAEQQTVTGPDGRFRLDRVPSGTATLIVRAGGFAVNEQPLSGAENLEVVLSPATVNETVTVTPTRSEQRAGDIPASVSVLTSDDIKASPAVVADDAAPDSDVQFVPATSSLSSHPTQQGVSLRESAERRQPQRWSCRRHPQNDPFGGWVTDWACRSTASDRIEVDGSTQPGNRAMAASSISSVTVHHAGRSEPRRSMVITGARRSTSGSDVWETGLGVSASASTPDGFLIVAPSERGLHRQQRDGRKFQNFDAKLD